MKFDIKKYDESINGIKSDIPLYFRSWWLDTVCKGNTWDVSFSKDEEGKINGLLPFMLENKGPLLLLRMPPLTPFIGVWIAPYKGERLHGRYSYEKRIMENLIDGLPKFHYFAQKFSPYITNWYPFYLKGFSQTTSYTYIIEDIKNHNQVWTNMKNTVRTAIRKAETILKVEESEDINLHIRLQKETFQRQELKIPFKEEVSVNIFKEVKQRDQGVLLKAYDTNGNTHATCLLVWDNTVAYNLMIGVDTEKRKSGAVQLLLWKAIQYASEKVDIFNFEGSMLPHIEPVFRHFGGKQTPYFRISKDSNRMVKIIRTILGR